MNNEHTALHELYNGDIELDEFRELVAKKAYYKAEKRNFEGHHELDDWLEAEREVHIQRRYWQK